MKKNDIIKLYISGYSNDGHGVGRHEGMAVFVPFTAVGDLLYARVVKVQKNYAFGIIESIIEPSENRKESDCPYFGKCGGCNFRHLEYDEELNAKQGFVNDALSRIGDLHIEVNTIIGAPETDHYRNKVQFPIASENGRLFPAFYQPRSHRAINIADSCKLQPDIMNNIASDSCSILSKLGETAYDETTHKGNIRHLLIRKSSLNGNVLLCVICCNGKIINEKRFINEIRQMYPNIATIVINENRTLGNEIISGKNHVIYGEGYIQDEINGVPVKISYDSFYQINQKSTELLYNCVRRFAEIKENEVVIDLYCGAGTIGLSCCDDSTNLIGVDVVDRAIQSAQEAAKKLGYEKARFYRSDSSFLTDITMKGIEPDLIITDPPRKGCSPAVIDAILLSKPNRIIMVSCNPATLARDLRLLVDGGYEIIEVQPFDLFPRTKHVETVCCLYHQKKDFIPVPYEPKDASYLKRS